MNAPKHDPDELKAALDALRAAEVEDARLKRARDEAHKRALLHGAVMNVARERAALLIKREGGSVVHDEEFWKVATNGAVEHEPVRVNLDALDELRLTPTDSERTP